MFLNCVCYIFHYCIPDKRSDLYKKDDPDWLTSVDLRGKQEPLKEILTARYQRRVNQTHQKLKVDAAHFLLLMDIPAADDSTTMDCGSDNMCSIGTQTEMTGDFIDSMTSELQNLRTENVKLRSDVAHLSSSCDQSASVGKDEKVLFFTGQPTF